MNAGRLSPHGYKSIEQIDAELTQQIRAFVRKERREALGRYAVIGVMGLCLALVAWFTTPSGRAFLAWLDGAR